MKIKVTTLTLLLLLLLNTTPASAQGTLAKLKFEEAEQAYKKNDFWFCNMKLAELAELGVAGPKLLHLKIMSTSCLVAGVDRLDKVFGGYQTLEQLREDCDYYLQNYDIQGQENLYKQVYNVKKEIDRLPPGKQQWDAAVKNILEKERQYKEQVIGSFMKNLVKVEKGKLYRGTRNRTKHLTRGYYSDEEIIENYKSFPGKVSIIDIDYDFYFVNQLITQDIVWAVMANNQGYWTRPKNDKREQYEISYFSKPQDTRYATDKISISKKGYPVNPGKQVSMSYANVLDFIKMLNSKTGKQFRILTEAEWEYAQRGGHKQQLDTIKAKTGGNKRKGYEYAYYYAYRSNEIWPCERYGSPKGCMEKPNEIGITVKSGVCSGGLTNENDYKSYSGKASDITVGGIQNLVIKKRIGYDDYYIRNDAFKNEAMPHIFALAMEAE